MPDEIGLGRPGWKFIYEGPAGKAVVAQIQDAARGGDKSVFACVKTTTGRRRIYLFTPPKGAEKYLLKCYLPAKFAKRLKYLVRNSRCRQEFFAAKKLEKLGIAAVKAVAFGCRTGFLLPAEEIVVEPFREDLKSFDLVWQESGQAERRSLFAAMARLTADMHQKGALQRDFKPDSVLARKAGSGFHLELADLERIKFSRAISDNQRIENLGKMLQSFFRALPCPEMDILLEEYSRQAGADFAAGVGRERVVLSAVAQLKKQAEQRQNWADKSNELIDKFEKNGSDLRVSREIGKANLEKLAASLLKEGETIEIAGKKLELISAESALEVMKKYYYLRELRIGCAPVALAVDQKVPLEGIAGIERDLRAKPLKKWADALAGEDRGKFFESLGEFLFRIELFGISFIGSPLLAVAARKSEDLFELVIARPDRVTLSKGAQVAVPSADTADSIDSFSGALGLSAADEAQTKQGFESSRGKLLGVAKSAARG